MRLMLALLLVFLQCGGAALAATREAPAYLTPRVEQLYPWAEGLRVRLSPDEAQCRKHYGGNWQAACRVFLGEDGAEAAGVQLTPAVAGSWTWEGGDTLRFTPAKPMTPDAAYHVQLKALRLPAQAKLTKTEASFRAIPQAARMPEWKFWVDPSPRAGHALSATLQFVWPVDAAAPVPRFLVDAASGLRLGDAEYIWNAARDALTISAPVRQLPRTATEVTLKMPNMRRFSVNEEGRVEFFPANKQKDVQFPLSVKSAASLFTVEALTLEAANDTQLNKGYELRLRTSLYTRPQDVLKALKVIQLPRTLQENAPLPYNWALAPAVPQSALDKGVIVQPVSLQPDDSPVSDLRFRVNVAPDSYLLVYLPAQFASATGLPLGRQWRQVLHANPQHSALHFLQPGHVLPLNGERKLDIYATDLTDIQWEVQQVRDPFMALLAAASDKAFTQPFDDAPAGMDSVSVLFHGRIRLKEAPAGTAQFTALDLSPLLDKRDDRRGLMRVKLTGLRGTDVVAETARMVLVTDLGLLVKQAADGSAAVFVNSLQTGLPVGQADVRVLGANGRPVAQARTNAQGQAMLPSLRGLEREKRPVAVVAEKSAEGQEWGDLAWLPLDDASLVTDYSAFPVTGRSLSESGINTFVFAQRGMFRPGEDLHFGMLTRRADWEALPAGLPLTAVLRSPAGTDVLKRVFTPGPDGLAEFSWPVPVDAPTGRYRLDVELDGGQVLGSGSARVEEFQPDTLALRARMLPERRTGWIHVTPDGLADGAPVQAEALLTTLHGLPAAGHRVKAALRVQPATLSFPGYEQYTFHDALPFHGEAAERALPDSSTDDKGRAALPLPAELVLGSTVRCDVLVEGYEADGGRAVSQPISALLSPLEIMLGSKPAGSITNLQFIPQGRQAALDFTAVAPDLSRTSTGPLTFTVYARRYVTSLVTDNKGAYRYDESPVDTKLSESTHTVGAQQDLRWPIPTDKAGEFLLTVRDAQKRTLAQIPFTVAGQRLALAEDGLAAGSLRLRLDKTEYINNQDDIQLFLSLPYDGTGLITLEREQVIAAKWFHAKAGDTVQTIDIPDDFEGRGYVNVTFVRSLASPDIYMEPSASIVVPFTSRIEQRDMGLTLKAPAKGLPGTALNVTLSAREKGRALVFAVDEGVLQLTRFATPNPLAFLLEDRALDVRTLQAFSLLMPDHAQLQGRIPGFGGDMSLLGGRFHNPFRRRDEPPLASWVMAETGPQPVTVSIPVPEYYNGTVRIMAVGGTRTSAGTTDARAVIAAPLVLTPRLPLTVTPGDSFTGSLLLSNTTDKDMHLTLEVQAGSALQPDNTAPRTLTVPAGKEVVTPLAFRVLANPGESTVRCTAVVQNGPRVERRAALSVRPATHRRLSQQAGKGSGDLTLHAERALFPLDAHRSAAVSALPLPALHTLTRYLETYPYGCLEQIISRAFPCVLLRDRPELLPSAKERDAVINAALTQINANLTGGGLALWPEGQPSLLLTAYAADLLLTMRETGMGMPEPLLARLCDSIENTLDSTAPSLEQARAAAYGIWVLTREGRVTTQLLEHLHSALRECGESWKGDITAALVAASQKLMHMRSVQPFRAPLSGSGGNWFDDLAAQSLYASILARHFPETLKDGSVAEDLADSTLMAMQSGRYATFSAAQAVRALAALNTAAAPALDKVTLTCAEEAPRAAGAQTAAGTPAAAARANTEGKAENTGNAGAPARNAATLSPDKSMLILDAPQCRTFRVQAPANGNVLYWQLTEEGFDREAPTQAVSQGLRITREYRNAAGETVSSAAQGEELTVTLTARSDSTLPRDCVLLDLLPGGVEMVLPRHGGNTPPEEQPAGLARMDRRDDRMILFAGLSTEPFTFSYRVRAVNKGRFILPPAQVEAMYDQTAHASTAAGTLEVR